MVKNRKRPHRTPIEIESISISSAFGATIFRPADWTSERLIFSAEEFRTQLVKLLGEPSKDELQAGLTKIYEVVSNHHLVSELADGFMLPFIIDYCEDYFFDEDVDVEELVEICRIPASRCLDRFIDRMLDVFNKLYEANNATELEAEAAGHLAEGWAAFTYATELRNSPILTSEKAKQLNALKNKNSRLVKQYIVDWYIDGKEKGDYRNAHHASQELASMACNKSHEIAENGGWKFRNNIGAQKQIYRWFLEYDKELLAREP